MTEINFEEIPTAHSTLIWRPQYSFGHPSLSQQFTSRLCTRELQSTINPFKEIYLFIIPSVTAFFPFNQVMQRQIQTFLSTNTKSLFTEQRREVFLTKSGERNISRTHRLLLHTSMKDVHRWYQPVHLLQWAVIWAFCEKYRIYRNTKDSFLCKNIQASRLKSFLDNFTENLTLKYLSDVMMSEYGSDVCSLTVQSEL